MTAIDHLRASDTLVFDRFRYRLTTPIGDFYPPYYPGLCKPMDGPLAFTMTSEEIGLPGDVFKLPFSGTADPVAGTVTWRVDQPISRWFKGAHLTRVRGSITTSVEDMNPDIGATCGGASERVYLSMIESPGSDVLTIETSLGDIHARDIEMSASAGEPLADVFFRIGVSGTGWRHDGCGTRFMAPNTDATFVAWPEDMRIVGTLQSITFAWSVVSGPATITGSSKAQSVTLHIAAEGIVSLKVKITIATDVHAGSEERAVSFFVFSDQVDSLLRNLCRFRKQFSMLPNAVVRGAGPGFTVGGIHVVDPLWDPLKSRIEKPVFPGLTDMDLKRLDKTLERLDRLGKMLRRELKESRGRFTGLSFESLLDPRDKEH